MKRHQSVLGEQSTRTEGIPMGYNDLFGFWKCLSFLFFKTIFICVCFKQSREKMSKTENLFSILQERNMGHKSLSASGHHSYGHVCH
jgi:hypothetical protein